MILASGGTEAQCERIWAKLDFDGDGALTVQEIAAALKVRQCLFERAHLPALVAIATTSSPRGLSCALATLWLVATFAKMRAPLGRAMAVETAVAALRRSIDQLRHGGGPQAGGGAEGGGAEGGGAEGGGAGAAVPPQPAASTAAARQWWA